MNCSQVRALFSARVDFELSGEQSREHDRHLTSCRSCDNSWQSFQTTVRIVRSLPAESPSSSFVGQVLDRVRAYEAQPVPTYLEPADTPPGGFTVPKITWGDRLREWAGALRSPVPAFALGALVLGFLAGVAATGWRSHPESPIAGTPQRSIPVSEPYGSVAIGGDHSVNPFADLADEIRRLPEPSAPVRTSSTVDVVYPTTVLWSSDVGLPQQVSGDARPRITF
jgi:hypothetical protein